MADLSERFRTIAQDLTHIEVNTILKPTMTGRKMPKPRHALIEIAQRYCTKLAELGFPMPAEEKRPGSFEYFDRIRERAHEAVLDLQDRAKERSLSEPEQVDLVMAFRIKTMSDQIKGIFNNLKHRGEEDWNNPYSHREVEERFPPLHLEPDEVVLIRKIWEMGLEEIAMQTIIQLDGDVVTRIQPRFADGNSSLLHLIHNESVTISLDFWGELIRMVKEFFKGLFDSPLTKR